MATKNQQADKKPAVDKSHSKQPVDRKPSVDKPQIKQPVEKNPAIEPASEDYRLEHMIGKRRDGRTGQIIKQSTGWDRLWKNGREIAKVHRHSGAPVCPTLRLTDEEAADAVAAVNRLRAAAGSPYGPSTRCGKFLTSAAEQQAVELIERQRARGGDDEDDGDDDDDGDELTLD